MFEALGVMLFCSGFFICAVAYAVSVIADKASSRFMEATKNELSYLTLRDIDKRIDAYLRTLYIVLAMLIIGGIAIIVGYVMVPGLTGYLGFLWGAMYGVIFVYNCLQNNMLEDAAKPILGIGEIDNDKSG